MDIFLSWSGDRSRKLAEALRVWLPCVIQSLNPWVSSHNLDKGSIWISQLSGQLGKHTYGIICLTPENLSSKWIHFEAGALTKTEASRAFTLLLGITPADIEQPLGQFNHTRATKEDIFQLLQNINSTNTDDPVNESVLAHSFELNWPDLETQIQNLLDQQIPADEKSTSPPPRDVQSMLAEILDFVRPKLSSSFSTVSEPMDGPSYNEPRVMEVMGARLREKRQVWQLTLREVEERSGQLAEKWGNPAYRISASWLDRVERGDRGLSATKLMILASIYSLDSDQMLALMERPLT